MTGARNTEPRPSISQASASISIRTRVSKLSAPMVANWWPWPRALQRAPRILVLDEVTASLSEPEVLLLPTARFAGCGTAASRSFM